jgi:hypothetical protein
MPSSSSVHITVHTYNRGERESEKEIIRERRETNKTKQRDKVLLVKVIGQFEKVTIQI